MNAHIKPIVATLGEPAGIGPDIALMARAAGAPAFCVVGCAETVSRRAEALGGAHPDIVPVTSIADTHTAFARGLPVLDLPVKTAAQPGKPSLANADAAVGWIDRACELVLSGDASGMVTGPIQKETLYGAGFSHQGHTDYLAHLATQAGHDCEPVMMLSCEGLRAVPLTVHVPLVQVPALVTGPAIISQARIIHRDLKRFFGINSPRIAVAGLNPHAGEGGTIGTEERTIINPAVEALRAEGIAASGPLAADTMFHDEARASYDAALCMYHDQALIPVKALGFDTGVNTTLGLPFIRTSPDHGTALSLAGTGKASPASFLAALAQAHQMAGVTA